MVFDGVLNVTAIVLFILWMFLVRKRCSTTFPLCFLNILIVFDYEIIKFLKKHKENVVEQNEQKCDTPFKLTYVSIFDMLVIAWSRKRCKTHENQLSWFCSTTFSLCFSMNLMNSVDENIKIFKKHKENVVEQIKQTSNKPFELIYVMVFDVFVIHFEPTRCPCIGFRV